MIKNIVSCFMVLILSGCSNFANNGPAYNEQNHTGTKLIVYRAYKLGDQCVVYDIFADNRSIGKLKCSGYLETAISPGHHTIKAVEEHRFMSFGQRTLTTSINAIPGRPNYIKLGASMFSGKAAPANLIGIAALGTIGVGAVFAEYNLAPVTLADASNEVSELHRS